MSNRMEELPGPDAFPMDLPAIISNFYSRAGFVYLNNGKADQSLYRHCFAGRRKPEGAGYRINEKSCPLFLCSFPAARRQQALSCH
jgi:hypothetical protein